MLCHHLPACSSAVCLPQFRALQGQCLCVFYLERGRGREPSLDSIQKLLSVLGFLRLMMQAVLPQESLCWLIYNGAALWVIYSVFIQLVIYMCCVPHVVFSLLQKGNIKIQNVCIGLRVLSVKHNRYVILNVKHNAVCFGSSMGKCMLPLLYIMCKVGRKHSWVHLIVCLILLA